MVYLPDHRVEWTTKQFIKSRFISLKRHMEEETCHQHPVDGDKSILQEEKQTPVLLVSSKSSGHHGGLGSRFATLLGFAFFTIAVKPVDSELIEI